MIGSQSLRKDIRIADERFAIHLAHSDIMIWSPPQDQPRCQSGLLYAYPVTANLSYTQSSILLPMPKCVLVNIRFHVAYSQIFDIIGVIRKPGFAAEILS